MVRNRCSRIPHPAPVHSTMVSNSYVNCYLCTNIWAPSSEFVSSSIPSWQILTAHAQPFRGARDLAFCLKGPLDSLLVWASSEGSGETARMRRLAWTFAARIGDKYQIRLTRSIWLCTVEQFEMNCISTKCMHVAWYNVLILTSYCAIHKRWQCFTPIQDRRIVENRRRR